MSLIAELQRRNVFRTALAYLVVSWLLLQVGDILFEALRLDDKALTVMLALLALGFIPVVVFSWIYELTPEGVKRESEVDRSQSITSQTGQRLNVAIAIMLTVTLALFAWDRFRPASPQDLANTSDQGVDAPWRIHPTRAWTRRRDDLRSPSCPSRI